MSHFPCCRHGKKTDGKLTNAYVSWYFPEDKRWCYYTRWCTDCFMEDIYPAIKHLKELGEQSESICIVTGEELEAPLFTYMTLFPPKQEQKEYQFATCPDCFEEFRNNLARGGKLIPDRGARDGAQAQAPSTTDTAWAEIEL